eukprot:COSAG04_NODE_950_length_9211_cov_69.923068_11_plen_96_part_00
MKFGAMIQSFPGSSRGRVTSIQMEDFGRGGGGDVMTLCNHDGHREPVRPGASTPVSGCGGMTRCAITAVPPIVPTPWWRRGGGGSEWLQAGVDAP